MRVDTVRGTHQDILNALANKLTIGANFSAFITSVQVSAPGVEFTVIHTLERIPEFFFYYLDTEGSVYASRRSEWTSQELYLKCSSTSPLTTAYLLVM